MRIAKETVVNLTINEHIRNRVSKTRRGFIGLFRKKKMRFLVKLILIYKSSQRARRAFFKKQFKYILKIRNKIDRKKLMQNKIESLNAGGDEESQTDGKL